MKEVRGFSLVELIITVTILTMVMLVGVYVYFSFFRLSILSTQTNQVLSHLREIQGRATNSLNNSAWGVHFNNTSYVVFQGLAFNPQNPANISYFLSDTAFFSSLYLPSSEIVFATLSGKVINFNPALNFLVISEKENGRSQKLTISEMGVVNVE